MGTCAQFFDGRTAEARDVFVELVGDNLQIQADDDMWLWHINDARLVPPVGKGAWRIELLDGGSLSFRDEEFGRQLGNVYGHGQLLRWFEGSWRWAVVALGVAIVGTWALLTYGVPIGARYIAFTVPPEINDAMSNEGLEFLDGVIFQPSELTNETKSNIRRQFEDIKKDRAEYANYRLAFRASEAIGPNAFAVPGGLVVITDDMVNIAESDAEISAVLAHEVGHQAHRHGLRILLQDSASALIIVGLTGDMASVTALSATVPTMLMQAKYSRDFEREADDFAFSYLESRGTGTDVLSELLLRIEMQADGGERQIPNWLSSHPESEHRISEE
jgi:Zn-dependent protease with chaperone function